MNINQIAEQFGINADSLTSFVSWVTRQIELNPSLVEVMQFNASAFIEAAMKEWLKQSKAYTDKLLDHNSQERKDLNSFVYNELRNGK